ncbi:MAG: hypothetical protein AB8B54_05540 [Sphingorhabdus sp.]
MEILFRRTQYQTPFGRVKFKLWGRIEPDEAEQKLIDTYDFRPSVLIGELQEGLIKQSLVIGFLAALISGTAIGVETQSLEALGIALPIGIGAGFWWFHARREVIFVRDLLHGRTFKCGSVIDLVQKEAKLEGASFLLRQVVESSKQWDGTEKLPIEGLPRDEAKEVILKAFPSVD